MNGYFEEELNIPVFHKPKEYLICNKRLFIGHGDGLGPGDKGFKRMKKVFKNPLAQWCFRWLHPDLGVRIAQYFSVKNKLISGSEDIHYLGDDKEWLVQYAKRKLETRHYDYFVFGHRHLPLEIPLNKEATYVNLGDWISHFTYAVLDEGGLTLQKYNP
jgi:UDP-2,3-diacylglucosamine hydrolase